MEALGRRPASKSSQDNETEPEIVQDEDEDDWRKFFEESSVPDSSNSKTPTARLHTLSVHQHLHSVASHKAVFTRAWLSLLSILSSISMEQGKTVALRTLDIMHRVILPHLTRPILVMDWVGSCVDYGPSFVHSHVSGVYLIRIFSGGSLGLLALNTLFVLMKEYNLCVSL